MRKSFYLSFFIFFLLISCCKEEFDKEITATWEVGIFHDAECGNKYLTFEINPSRGKIQALDITTYWIFYNQSQSTTLTLKDTDFNLSTTNKNGMEGITWTSLNYILNDYSWSLKEVQIKGRVKVSNCWYSINSRKIF